MKQSIFILIVIIVFFSSCRKEASPLSVNQQTSTLNNDTCKTCSSEQAFPNLPSQLIKIKNGNGEITIEKKGDNYVYLGDILLTEQQVDLLKRSNELTTAVIDGFTNYWRSGIVYFTINASLPNQQRVLDAIAHWQANSSIRFIQRTTQTDYIEFISSTGCSSFVGRIGGRQVINLAAGCSTGNTIHEIGHAIGFFHEQSRIDRNNSIIINWNNIQTGFANNFQTYTVQGFRGIDLGLFDFGSIMLYSSFDFSANGLPTITRLNGTTFVGQRIGLSNGDIQASNYIYGPPYLRVEYNYTVDDYDNGNIYQAADIFVRSYSNASCTTPFTTPTALNFACDYYETTHYNNGTQNNSFQTHGRYVIPAGQNSVLLQNDLVVRNFQYDYNYVMTDETRSYVGTNASFR